MTESWNRRTGSKFIADQVTILSFYNLNFNLKSQTVLQLDRVQTEGKTDRVTVAFRYLINKPLLTDLFTRGDNLESFQDLYTYIFIYI